MAELWSDPIDYEYPELWKGKEIKMEIKITKEIKELSYGNDVRITLYVDGKESSSWWVGEATDEWVRDSIVYMMGNFVVNKLKITDKDFKKDKKDG